MRRHSRKEPGTRLSSSVRWRRWFVAAVPAVADGGGCSSDAVDSQCWAVAGTASSMEAGHDGTMNAAVVAELSGGMIVETCAR